MPIPTSNKKREFIVSTDLDVPFELIKEGITKRGLNIIKEWANIKTLCVLATNPEARALRDMKGILSIMPNCKLVAL